MLVIIGGGSVLCGLQLGEFDYVVWVMMIEEGLVLVNLFFDGIWDENVVMAEFSDFVKIIIVQCFICVELLLMDGVVFEEV